MLSCCLFPYASGNWGLGTSSFLKEAVVLLITIPWRVTQGVCISFAPLYCRVLFHGVDGPQLTHSLGGFQFGSSHAKCLWAFVCKLLCELHFLGSTITGSCGSCMFSSLKNCQTAPQSGCTTVLPTCSEWVREPASQPRQRPVLPLLFIVPFW